MRSWDEVECVEGVMPHEGKGGERGRGRGRGGSVVRWVILGERGMALGIYVGRATRHGGQGESTTSIRNGGGALSRREARWCDAGSTGRAISLRNLGPALCSFA